VHDVVDLLIVGGGPVGLYGAFYAGLRNLSTKIIDALPDLGGQLTNLYPTSNVLAVAGHESIQASKLVENLTEQAMQFQPQLALGERVFGISKQGDQFEVVTDKGQHSARTVLLAVGPGAFVPSSIFNLPGKAQQKMGLFLDDIDVAMLAGRRVLICGGKQEVIGWAVEAGTVAASITAITSYDIYGSDLGLEPALSMVDVMSPYHLKQIHGTPQVEAATIVNQLTGDETRLKVDAVLMARGQLTNLEHVQAWGVEMDAVGIKVDRSMRTSVEGIFAAGDIVSYDGKIFTINAGAGEAAIAANNAKVFIDPGTTLQPKH
jgi:thioredoxin reductase